MWGGLLDTLSYNLNRKQERAMLFEIGSTYHDQNGQFQEHARVSGLFYGDVLPEQWSTQAREVDFFDVKATVELLTHQDAEFRVETHPALHPGQSC